MPGGRPKAEHPTAKTLRLKAQRELKQQKLRPQIVKWQRTWYAKHKAAKQAAAMAPAANLVATPANLVATPTPTTPPRQLQPNLSARTTQQ
jgi:hypothetical protein